MLSLNQRVGLGHARLSIIGSAQVGLALLSAKTFRIYAAAGINR